MRAFKRSIVNLVSGSHQDSSLRPVFGARPVRRTLTVVRAKRGILESKRRTLQSPGMTEKGSLWIRECMVQSGRSMVEILGVLAIIGVLTIGAAAGYKAAMEMYRAGDIANEVSLRMTDITGFYEVRFLSNETRLTDWSETTNSGYPIDTWVGIVDPFTGEHTASQIRVDNVQAAVCKRVFDLNLHTEFLQGIVANPPSREKPIKDTDGIVDYRGDDSICDVNGENGTVTMLFDRFYGMPDEDNSIDGAVCIARRDPSECEDTMVCPVCEGHVCTPLKCDDGAIVDEENCVCDEARTCVRSLEFRRHDGVCVPCDPHLKEGDMNGAYPVTSSTNGNIKIWAVDKEFTEGGLTDAAGHSLDLATACMSKGREAPVEWNGAHYSPVGCMPGSSVQLKDADTNGKICMPCTSKETVQIPTSTESINQCASCPDHYAHYELYSYKKYRFCAYDPIKMCEELGEADGKEYFPCRVTDVGGALYAQYGCCDCADATAQELAYVGFRNAADGGLDSKPTGLYTRVKDACTACSTKRKVWGYKCFLPCPALTDCVDDPETTLNECKQWQNANGECFPANSTTTETIIAFKMPNRAYTENVPELEELCTNAGRTIMGNACVLTTTCPIGEFLTMEGNCANCSSDYTGVLPEDTEKQNLCINNCKTDAEGNYVANGSIQTRFIGTQEGNNKYCVKRCPADVKDDEGNLITRGQMMGEKSGDGIVCKECSAFTFFEAQMQVFGSGESCTTQCDNFAYDGTRYCLPKTCPTGYFQQWRGGCNISCDTTKFLEAQYKLPPDINGIEATATCEACGNRWVENGRCMPLKPGEYGICNSLDEQNYPAKFTGNKDLFNAYQRGDYDSDDLSERKFKDSETGKCHTCMAKESSKTTKAQCDFCSNRTYDGENCLILPCTDGETFASTQKKCANCSDVARTNPVEIDTSSATAASCNQCAEARAMKGGLTADGDERALCVAKCGDGYYNDVDGYCKSCGESAEIGSDKVSHDLCTACKRAVVEDSSSGTTRYFCE